MQNKIKSSPRYSQAGVSLVELMVGLTVGIIITAGALTILFTNQKYVIEKDALDRSQENFRFVSTTITRIVRQSTSFRVPANNDELVVNFDRSQRDCLGQANNSSINTFRINDKNELICILDRDSENKSYVLAKDIPQLSFKYGIQNGTSALSLNYYPYFNGTSGTPNQPLVNAWDTVTSVLTQMSVTEGSGKQSVVDFIATSHLQALSKLASSGGTRHAPIDTESGGASTGGDGTDSNGENGSSPEDSNDGNDGNDAQECSNTMLANISVSYGLNTNTWERLTDLLSAPRGSLVMINVRAGINTLGWQIAKDNGSFSALRNTSYTLPNGDAGQTMTLKLQCNNVAKGSLNFVIN